MDREVANHFRDQFREARAVVLKDAEAFEQIVFVIERLGVYLMGRLGDMGKYADSVSAMARRSPLAQVIPAQIPEHHAAFATVYKLVQNARNDALHEGAFARHLTIHAIELALVLEDALMSDA